MTTTLAITGMHCAGCAAGVRAALLSVPGVSSARVDLAEGRATVEHAPGVEVGPLLHAVQDQGFEASPVSG